MSVDVTLGELTMAGLEVRAQPDLEATLGQLEMAGLRASVSDVPAPGELRMVGLNAETWYAVFESATGRLVSVGTRLGELPPGRESVELGGRPADGEMWDAATRTFIPRPAKATADRADDALERLEHLSGADRAAVRDAIVGAFPEELRGRPGG